MEFSRVDGNERSVIDPCVPAAHIVRSESPELHPAQLGSLIHPLARALKGVPLGRDGLPVLPADTVWPGDLHRNRPVSFDLDSNPPVPAPSLIGIIDLQIAAGRIVTSSASVSGACPIFWEFVQEGEQTPK
jgi:hypothetical protein